MLTLQIVKLIYYEKTTQKTSDNAAIFVNHNIAIYDQKIIIKLRNN